MHVHTSWQPQLVFFQLIAAMPPKTKKLATHAQNILFGVRHIIFSGDVIAVINICSRAALALIWFRYKERIAVTLMAQIEQKLPHNQLATHGSASFYCFPKNCHSHQLGSDLTFG